MEANEDPPFTRVPYVPHTQDVEHPDQQLMFQRIDYVLCQGAAHPGFDIWPSDVEHLTDAYGAVDKLELGGCSFDLEQLYFEGPDLPQDRLLEQEIDYLRVIESGLKQVRGD